MKNISFDNPYLLLVLIPLLLFIIVPICWAIRKENRSKSVVASTVLHIVIALCISLALGGMIYTRVNTKTQVYVVADVSYSSNRNLEQVDAYIRQIEKNLPRNSEMGVIVFARDHKVLTPMGGKFTSVTKHGFTEDVISATNISTPLTYVANMFDDDAIKRVVLITDGKQTRTDAAGELAGAVDNLYANDIYIDAVFLDNNLPSDVKEIQITDVQFAPSTYKGHTTYAEILIQSTYDTEDVILNFLSDMGNQRKAIKLSAGWNMINFELPTDQAGEFDYRFSLEVDKKNDSTDKNNTFEFKQIVAEKMNVLMVSGDAADEAKARELFGPETEVEFLLQKKVGQPLTVPCTVEELCKYDQIVISNIDIRDIDNVVSFVDAVDTVVSQYGKSLVTMGDLRVQNREDEELVKLEDMLPVKFGNSDQDPRLYALVLDTSRSMNFASRMQILKLTATHLLNTLKDDDYVMVVNFWGDFKVLVSPTPAKNREQIIEAINELEVAQGTMIGTALKEAGDFMVKLDYAEKQVMLISDGRSFANEKDNCVDVAKNLYNNNITVSAIYPGIPRDPNDQVGYPGLENLQNIVKAGGGHYYSITATSDIQSVVFDQVIDDMTESIVERPSKVNVEYDKDDVLTGITGLPEVDGYVYAKAKASATTVLTMDYYKPGMDSNDSSVTPLKAPLYSYWNYGNGKVSTFTSTFTGSWTDGWAELRDQFFANVAVENVPRERINYPYELNVTYDGTYSELEIIPSTLNPKATVDVTITIPGQDEPITATLNFDTTRYFFRFETPKTGTYLVDVRYNFHANKDPFEAKSAFSISYSPEYNMFENFDAGALHAAIRNRGTVSEGKIPSLKNNDKEVATTTMRLVAPLMILAVVLYVIDIIIRKLKIADIKSFFGIKPKKGAGR